MIIIYSPFDILDPPFTSCFIFMGGSKLSRFFGLISVYSTGAYVAYILGCMYG